jgi:hypothetical protein
LLGSLKLVTGINISSSTSAVERSYLISFLSISITPTKGLTIFPFIDVSSLSVPIIFINSFFMPISSSVSLKAVSSKSLSLFS